MIQTIEKQRDEIYNPGDGPHSTTAKSSNENTPNIPKKSLPSNSHITISKIPLKNGLNHFNKTPLDSNDINNNSADKDKHMNNINSTQESFIDSKNKKEFIEKKRRRRNRCSYSNCRNKKFKKRVNVPQIPQMTKLIDNETPSKNQNEPEKKTNKSISIDLEERKINENETTIKKDNKEQKETNTNSKKKIKIDEKELIANAEKKFMEKLNKEYPDEQYNKDLEINLKEKKVQFMKENFPIMYRKDKYYLYTILLKRRRTQPVNFIQPNTLSQDILESKKHQTLYSNEELSKSEQSLSENSENEKTQQNKNITNKKNISPNTKSQIKNVTNHQNHIDISSINPFNNNSNKTKKEMEEIKQGLTEKMQPIKELNKKYGPGLSDTSQSEHDAKNSEINHIIDDIEEQNKSIKFKKTYNLLPRQIWSLPKDKNELDIEMFYDDCIQIWPFAECIFVKEIALEFLMKNNYSTTTCLKRLKDFVSFMKKRAEELNMSIINKNEKTVKKYSLRNTKGS